VLGVVWEEWKGGCEGGEKEAVDRLNHHDVLESFKVFRSLSIFG
jgi:hypothetical protein